MTDVMADVEYGVVLGDGVPGDTEPQAVMAVIAPTAVQAYPNPCGTWCDVGNLRDVWWAALWIAAMASVIGSGLHTAATVTFLPPSTGTATVTYPLDAFYTREFTMGSLDFSCVEDPPNRVAVMGCNSGDFYLGRYEGSCPGNSNSERQAALRDQVAAKAPNVAKVPSLPEFSVIVDSVNFTVTSNKCRKGDFDLGGTKTYGLLVLGILLSIVIGTGLVGLTRAVPREMMIGSVAVIILAHLAAAVMFAIKGIDGTLGYCVGCCIIILLCCCLFGIISPFGAMCFQMSSRVILHYWGTLVIAVVVQFIHAAFIVTWLFSVRNLDRLEASSPLLWGHVLVLYWGTQVFRNVVYVTMSGVTSDWFFSEYQGTRRGSVTLDSAKRAAVWSLGSICFGSLTAGIVGVVCGILRLSMCCCGGIMRCQMQCLLSCVESVQRHFNGYAYVHVAMFGKPYITAARDTWALVKNDSLGDWNAVVANSVIYHFGLIMAFAGAMLVGSVLFVASGGTFLWFMAGQVIGFMVVSIVTRQIYSGVMTVFIGFWQVCLQHCVEQAFSLVHPFHPCPLNIPLPGPSPHSSRHRVSRGRRRRLVRTSPRLPL